MSQAFTHAFLLCWGWKRTRSRKPLAGDADGTQGQISLVLRNVAPLSFPSLSVDAVGGVVQYGAHWFLMARRRDEPVAPPQ